MHDPRSHANLGLNGFARRIVGVYIAHPTAAAARGG